MSDTAHIGDLVSLLVDDNNHYAPLYGIIVDIKMPFDNDSAWLDAEICWSNAIMTTEWVGDLKVISSLHSKSS